MTSLTSAEAILKGLAPQKSASTYDMAWDSLRMFVADQRKKQPPQSETCMADVFQNEMSRVIISTSIKLTRPPACGTTTADLATAAKGFMEQSCKHGQGWLFCSRTTYNQGYSRKTAKVLRLNSQEIYYYKVFNWTKQALNGFSESVPLPWHIVVDSDVANWEV